MTHHFKDRDVRPSFFGGYDDGVSLHVMDDRGEGLRILIVASDKAKLLSALLPALDREERAMVRVSLDALERAR